MTTGRLTSSSQPERLLGTTTIAGGPQEKPSLLSTRAMLRLGRQENHMRYIPASRRTETSKQVPSPLPRTGFLAYFTQPPAVSAESGAFSSNAGSDASSAASDSHTTSRRVM